MNNDIEQNFVVFGVTALESNEDQLTIRFQIQIRELFDVSVLLANGLIGCTSGIKREFASHNYVTNDNLTYYHHETVSILS